MQNHVVKAAIEIAKDNLRSCYKENGIVAGTHHFTDYWARDGFFAAFGCLAIKDEYIVKQMVNLFFSFQRQDGLIPYRIMRGPISLEKYLGKPKQYKNLRPTYRLRGLFQEVLDGTTLTLLFAALTKDTKHLPNIKLALNYLTSKERDHLLWDGVMAEWNDTALKWGSLLYSNIIYWYVYDRLEHWSSTFDQKWNQELQNKKRQIGFTLRQKLWNGKYFADWYDYKRQEYFYPFGNCLAIAWGFTTKAESASILEICEHNHVKFTLETNSPSYPLWRIDPLQNLIGMGDYQNHSFLWWQPIMAYLAALNKTGKKQLSQQILTLISSKIYQDGLIYECYDRNEKPIKRLFYQSEGPFAWSSGLMLWAIGLSANQNQPFPS